MTTFFQKKERYVRCTSEADFHAEIVANFCEHKGITSKDISSLPSEVLYAMKRVAQMEWEKYNSPGAVKQRTFDNYYCGPNMGG